MKETSQRQSVFALSHNDCKYPLLSRCSQKWGSFQKSRHSTHLSIVAFLWILCFYCPSRDNYTTSLALYDSCCFYKVRLSLFPRRQTLPQLWSVKLTWHPWGEEGVTFPYA
jgi:hypothetical protein